MIVDTIHIDVEGVDGVTVKRHDDGGLSFYIRSEHGRVVNLWFPAAHAAALTSELMRPVTT